MNGTEQYYVVAADGKEYGPADLEALRQWVREGRVVKATHIRKGSGGVTFAGKIPELADLFPARDTGPGAGQMPPLPPLPSTVSLPAEFRVWEFIGLAWNLVKPHWLALAAMFFLQIFILVAAMLCIQVVVSGFPKLFGHISGTMAQYVIEAPIMIGIWRAILGMIGGRKPEVGMMFGGFDRFLDAFLASVVVSLLTTLGFICLIVPGIILAIMWMFTLPVLSETSVGFWEAMQESARLTEGYRLRLFLLFLACLLVALLGALVCCVGVLLASPVIVTALALAYRFLQGKKGAPVPAPAPTPA